MQAQSHKFRILVVDDVADNRELLEDLFLDEGFDVQCEPSVAQARKALQQAKTRYDLILSDISMPEETGFDLLAWRNRQTKEIQNIPVLLITAALPEDEYRVRGLSMGAVDYVIRPISNQELVLRVQHAIDNYYRYSSLKTALQDSQDLASVGRILAAANHEIRNLSTLILMTSEQIVQIFGRAGGPESDVGQKALQSLNKSSRLLADISRDLNATVGRQAIRLRSLDLTSIVNDVVELVSIKAKSIKIESKFISSEKYWASCDDTRVKQILINFLLNAMDSIADARSSSMGYVEIKMTESDPSHWQIRVTDDGAGLRTAGHTTVFEPFATTKSTRGGKGLGLWWSSQLASAMQGTIELQSDGPGKGATAILTLPKADQIDAPIDLQKYLDD